MNLDIRNPEQVISDSSELLALASKIEGEVSNLQAQKAKIEGSWTSDTTDRESTVAGLTKNINNLNALIAGIRKVADDASYYAERSIEISRNQINVENTSTVVEPTKYEQMPSTNIWNSSNRILSDAPYARWTGFGFEITADTINNTARY